MTFKIHPVAALFPMMTDAELEELAEDIEKHGLCQPIVLNRDESTVIDGRNRLRACQIAGANTGEDYLVTTALPEMTEGEILDYVISANLHRRHLSAGQKAALAYKLKPMYAEAAKKRQREHGGTAPGKPKETLVANSPQVSEHERKSREQAAKAVGSSGRSVSDFEAIKKEAPDLAEKVENNEMTLNAATKERKKRQEPKKPVLTPTSSSPTHDAATSTQEDVPTPARRGKIDSPPVIDALNTWIDGGNSGRDGLVEFVKQHANVKLSHGQLETKLRELHAVRDADLVTVDWDSIPGNQQQKLERAKASIRRELEKEFRTRLLAQVDQYKAECDANVAVHKAKLDAEKAKLDAENQRQRAARDKERARYKEGIAVYSAKGLITPKEYALIRRCLHPDTEAAREAAKEEGGMGEMLKKAFTLFNDSKIKTLLVKEV